MLLSHIYNCKISYSFILIHMVGRNPGKTTFALKHKKKTKKETTHPQILYLLDSKHILTRNTT